MGPYSRLLVAAATDGSISRDSRVPSSDRESRPFQIRSDNLLRRRAKNDDRGEVCRLPSGIHVGPNQS